MKQRRVRKQHVPLSHSNLSLIENMASNYDPNGAYTGVPLYAPSMPLVPTFPDMEEPVQDVDDL